MFAETRFKLLRESEVMEEVSKVVECQVALPLTALIGPNIMIGRSFDSPEAAIAMNFVRATGVQGRKIAPEKRIYATLAVSGEALISTEELLRFLNQLIVAEAHVRSWQAAYAAIVPDEDLAQLSVDAKACRNDGALSTLSARALMVR